MGKIISFINLKGGVGKTTTCFNIGGNLAFENNKVLLVDLDAQANLSTAVLGVEEYERRFINGDQITNNVYQIFLDAINRTHEFKPEFIIKGPIKFKDRNVLPSLDLIPAHVNLMQLEKQIVNYERMKFRILLDYFEKIKEDYDYILIDCPPNIYTATHNALYASDYYVIPTKPDFLSSNGIPLLTQSLKNTIDIRIEERNETVKCLGVIISMIDSRLNTHKEYVKKIDEILKLLKEGTIINNEAKLFNHQIKQKVDVTNAISEYVPICIHNPRSDSNSEFRQVTHELTDTIDEMENNVNKGGK